MAISIALPEETTAAGRYSELEQDRNPFLDRARDCSALTVPAIMPPQGFGSTSKLPTPYQSLGARGVRTLASKLLLSQFPGLPFFNYQLDDQTLEKLGSKRGDIETALSSRERAACRELNTSGFRPAAFLVFQHLLVCGNALVRLPSKEGKAQVWRLDQYVTRRDAKGTLLEFVIKEATDFKSLPEDLRKAVLVSQKDGDKVDLTAKPLDLYTHGYWDHTLSKWVVYQEAAGIRIPESASTFNEGELEYLALRFSFQPGEHYGRSYVEEYLGDLDSLEALSETLVEGTAASARVIFLVRPGGVTSIRVIEKAKNGAVVSGDANDVQAMQVQKQADLSVARSQAEDIATRLSYAFLLHSSIQRNGDRVTAEEIRFMASELDDGLGGVYTFLAYEFQLPLVPLLEKRMETRLKVPKLPVKTVQPVVVTGLEAIGRGHDQRNLQAFVKEIIGVLGPELAKQYIKVGELVRRSAASYNIDTNGLIPTDDEIAASEQQAQMQALIQHLGPQAISQLGGLANTGLKGAMAPTQAPPQG